MEVTASGLSRQRRKELQELVERLHGTWSGALTVGRTAAVVVPMPGAAPVDWLAPKLAVARQHGIAVVSSEWLEDSAQHGFLLATARYQLSPPPPGRRSSANSTSLAGAAPAPTAATTAAAALPAQEQQVAPPPPLQHQEQRQQQQQECQQQEPPCSPEVERLRAARPPLAPLQAPPFLERSPAAASAVSPPSVGLHAAALDDLCEPLPSPATAPDLRSSAKLAGLLPSPLPLLALGEEAGLSPLSQAGSCGPAVLLPSPASLPGSALGRVGGRAAGTPASQRSEQVTPVGAAALDGGGLRSPSTDSDIVARFMSRMPYITVARGSALPRRHLAAASPSSSDGTSIRSSPSSGRGRAMSVADSPAECVADSPADGCSRWSEGGGALQLEGASARAAGTPVAEAAGEGASGGVQPTHGPVPPQWQTESVVRMRALADGGLPATTLVRLGALLQRPPARSTLQGLQERHGGGEEGGELEPPHASFYASATALPEGGAELRFEAGDISHGAVMLYDLGEGGRPVYAPVLIQSIYRLDGQQGGSGSASGGSDSGGGGGGPEVWMEHRYLLTRADLEERPAWAAALRGHAIADDEVLLSAGSYHSPMHLIVGEFWLRFPGRARRVGGQPAASAAGAGSQAWQPTFLCRKGFDTAACAVVPLRRALDGFAG